MAPLDRWLAWAPVLERIYQEELGRSAFSDPEAFVNWTYHWRESGHDEQWVLDRIRESPEWRARHPGNEPPAASQPPLQHGLVQITDASDGTLVPRTYSYWPNALIREDGIYCFFPFTDGVRFFRIRDRIIDRLGHLVSALGETGEGRYWNHDGFLYYVVGPQLKRFNPLNGDTQTVFDIAALHPNCRLWQCHSSDDGRTHSGTVQQIVADGAYPSIASIVSNIGSVTIFPAQGQLDESHLDRSGRFLVILENHDNRIIDLETGDSTVIADAEGAVAHADCGDGFIVGEDNHRGACIRWNLKQLARGPDILFRTWNMGHVSVRGGRCLVSDQTSLSLAALDGSGVTPILEHGMTGSGYDAQVQGSLDPSGQVATCLSNRSGRLEAYLLTL